MALYKTHDFTETGTFTVPAGGIKIAVIYTIEDGEVTHFQDLNFSEQSTITSLATGLRVIPVQIGAVIPGGYKLIYSANDTDVTKIIEYYELT